LNDVPVTVSETCGASTAVGAAEDASATDAVTGGAVDVSPSADDDGADDDGSLPAVTGAGFSPPQPKPITLEARKPKSAFTATA